MNTVERDEWQKVPKHRDKAFDEKRKKKRALLRFQRKELYRGIKVLREHVLVTTLTFITNTCDSVCPFFIYIYNIS